MPHNERQAENSCWPPSAHQSGGAVCNSFCPDFQIQLKGLDHDAAGPLPILAKWLRKSVARKSEVRMRGGTPGLCPMVLGLYSA